MLIDIKIKKSTAELGHNDHLKIYVDHKKFTSALGFKVGNRPVNMCIDLTSGHYWL